MLSGAGLSGGFSGSNEPGLRFPPGLHKEVACGGSQRPEELRAEPSPHCRGRRCVEAEPAGHAGSRGRSSCRLQPPALHKLPVQVVWPGRPIGCQEDPGPCKIGPRARALPSRCHRRRLDAPCQRLGGSRQDFSGTEKVVGRSLAGASKLNLEDESTGEAGRMQLLDRSARGKIGRGATPSEAELPPSKPGGASRSAHMLQRLEFPILKNPQKYIQCRQVLQQFLSLKIFIFLIRSKFSPFPSEIIFLQENHMSKLSDR